MDLGTFDSIAQEADLYSQLKAEDWGRHGAVTTYQYDANGAMIEKVVVEADRTTTEVFDYSLENRLVTHVKTVDDGVDVTVTTTEYTYNHEGIRVGEHTIVAINGIDQPDLEETRLFLIDSYNQTGYAQVLEERESSEAAPSVAYTIGDDVLLQSTRRSLGEGGPMFFDNQWLLPDGHGSTRQLIDTTGAITAQYAFDAYGVMLGQQAGSQQETLTSLLYAGEQFDVSLQQYYLRARYYDQANAYGPKIDPMGLGRWIGAEVGVGGLETYPLGQ